MRLNPSRLLPASHPCYYLHGADEDAVVEAAEALLADGDADAQRIRVDVSELARIEEASRNRGLFGPSICYALVRNAQSANPKQSEHLLKLAQSTAEENRLVICAPGIDWKKAVHKKMRAIDSVAECEFSKPDERAFSRWLTEQLKAAGLLVDDEAAAWMAERLTGMRLAARQMIERLNWYDGGNKAKLPLEVVAELLGERAPEALEAWCHAVAARRPEAIGLARRLLADQQVAEVQMISWLGTRIQQLLMYRWFSAQRHRNALQAARVFGDARSRVTEEVRSWKGSELALAMSRISAAEKLLKGASIEDRTVVIERLTLDLVAPERLTA